MISVDTNIYIYSLDRRDGLKHAIAQAVVSHLKRLRSPIALQMVGELQNVVRRKLKAPPAYAAAVALEVLTHHPTFAYGDDAVIRALNEAARGRLSYWDALMLASAAEAGCTAMLSEDMQDGARIFGLEVINPFGSESMSRRAAELLNAA